MANNSDDFSSFATAVGETVYKQEEDDFSAFATPVESPLRPTLSGKKVRNKFQDRMTEYDTAAPVAAPVAEAKPEATWRDDLAAGLAGLKQAYAGLEFVHAEGIKKQQKFFQGGLVDRLLPGVAEDRKKAISDLEQFQLEQIGNMGAASAEQKQIPESAAATKFNNAKSFGEAWNAFLEAPAVVTRSTVLRSAAPSLPSVVLGIAGSILGPGGAAAGAGVGSFSTEMGGTIGDELEKLGADLENPRSVAETWSKHKDAIIKTAMIRGGVVGGVDAVTGGVGSKIAAAPMGVVKKELAGTAVQMAGGAAGETGAQLATEGKITQPAAIMGEAIGELGSGAVEQGGQIVVEAVKRGRDKIKGGGAVAGDDFSGFATEVKGDGSRSAPVKATATTDVELARRATAKAPSDAQKAAGNYKKGHVQVAGVDITLENPKGSERKGKDRDGKDWSVTMPADYGYVKRTTGADGDQVDVFIGDKLESPTVFVIDQVDNETGAFDEHKGIIGAASAEEAKKLYTDSFSDGKGGDRIGAIHEMPIEEFKTWARDGDTSQPLWKSRTPLKVAETPAQPFQDAEIAKSGVPAPGKAPRAPVRSSGADAKPETPPIGAAPMAPRQAKTKRVNAIARRDVADDVAITTSGRKVLVRYAVVEARDLVASQDDEGNPNPSYPAEMQPRDRERKASLDQIQTIASKLEPLLLDKSAKASDGAPIVAEDGVVESGNGRTLSIRRAYQRNMPTAEAYRTHLKNQGYPVDGMKEPVLVRVRQGEMTTEERLSLAEDANNDDKLGLSAPEQALIDARRLSPDVMALYREGDLDTVANNSFRRAFLEKVVSKGDRGKMLQEDGAISVEGMRRISGAMIAKGYGNSELLAKLLESTDNTIKGIGGALLDVAGVWSQMVDEAKAGKISRETDQTDKLLEAVRMVDRSRREGKPLNLLVKQNDIFTGETVDVITEAFLRLMYRDDTNWRQPVSRQALATALRSYVDEARATMPGPDLVGEPPAQSKDILKTAKRKQADGYDDGQNAGQEALDLTKPKPAEGGGRDSGKGAGTSSSDGKGSGVVAEEKAPRGDAGGAGEVEDKPTVKPDLKVEAKQDWLIQPGEGGVFDVKDAKFKLGDRRGRSFFQIAVFEPVKGKFVSGYDYEIQGLAGGRSSADVSDIERGNYYEVGEAKINGQNSALVSSMDWLGEKFDAFLADKNTPESVKKQINGLIATLKAKYKELGIEYDPTPKEEATAKQPATSETDVAKASVSEKPKTSKPAKDKKPSAYGAKNTMVSAERAAELSAKLKAKLSTQMNAGIDPEILAMGAELAAFHIEAGARKFADFAKAVSDDLGMELTKLRPYLRSWFNGARDMMEDNGLDITGMEDAEGVKAELAAMFRNPASVEGEKTNMAAPAVEQTITKPATNLPDKVIAPAGDKAIKPQTLDLFGGEAPAAEVAASIKSEGATAKAVGEKRVLPKKLHGRKVIKEADAWLAGWDKENQNPAAIQANEPNVEEQTNGSGQSAGLRQSPQGMAGGQQPGSAEQAAGPEPVSVPGGQDGGGNLRPDGGPDAVGNQQPVQQGAGEPAGQDGGVAGDTDGGGRIGDDRVDPAAVAATVEADRNSALPPNYRITDADQIGQGGAKAKVAGNLAAIRLIRELEVEGRMASPSEQAVLVRYVGWGAFAQDMFQDSKPEWAKERAELKELLSRDEYEAARASVLNAHYTSPDVIKGMWSAMQHLGFAGGRVIEPAVGAGHFIGMTPEALHTKIEWAATELDKITGAVAKNLYQRADINVQGFESLNRPNGYYDAAISNVPFGSFNIRDKRYDKNFLIHDYFFVRSLDLVRPGGVVAFITSSGTMDKANDTARREIAKRADMIGAIRLPGGKKGAFAGNAGTEVTTDIIFLLRKGDKVPSTGIKWADLKEVQTPDGPVSINEYFAERPDMMLGEMRLQGTMYSAASPVLLGDSTGLAEKIQGAAAKMQAGAYLQRGAALVQEKVAPERADQAVREGSFYVDGGTVRRKVMGLATSADLSKVDEDKVTRLIALRDTVNKLLDVKRDKKLDTANRERLNRLYDSFVAKHGPINKETVTVTTRLNKSGDNIIIRKLPNMAAFRRDPDSFKVAAIENYDPETGKASKAAIFKGDVTASLSGPQITNAVDSVGWSLNAFGGIEPQAMADQLGISRDRLIADLGDRIYLNPNGETWQTAEQYLAGDVVEKLEQAQAAAEADKSYQRNVDALIKVQPEPLGRADIIIPFGSPWVPADVFNRFLVEEVGTYNDMAKVALNPVTKQWMLAAVNFTAAAQAKYGTSKVNVAEVVSHALAMKSPRVTVKSRNPDGSTTETVDEDATREAGIKVQQLRAAFAGSPLEGIEGWVWSDEDRSVMLEKLYNHKYNRLVAQTFNGDHLTLPGLATHITDGAGQLVPFSLRSHQKAAVWRVLQNGNTLFDHVVGAGKTFTMIATGMEAKRLGMMNRPMYVVPNHMLDQFSREFLQAYPGANILVAQKEEMSRDNRKAFAAKIAAERWDGIIITHDAFGRLPLDQSAYADFIREEIDEIKDAYQEAKSLSKGKDPTVKELEKLQKRAESRLAELLAKERKDDGVLFEELGVDGLFIDEAHLFKNLSFHTTHTRVKGLAQGNSQRAMDLFLKVRHLEKAKPGRSTVFATGTPISNTMAEMFTMQRYLQMDEMKKYGVDRFDAWAQTYGEIVTSMELSPDGRTFRETSSFSRFINMPELIALYSRIGDTKTADMLNLPRPKLKDGKVTIVEAEPSPYEERVMAGLVARAEQVRGKRSEKGGDNMLRVVSDGRKVATDVRLYDETADFNPNGKVGKAVANLKRIYEFGRESPVAKAQIVFLDMGVPQPKAPTISAKKVPVREEDAALVDAAFDGEESETALDDSVALRAKYNLYEELRGRLVAAGIPRNEIAFIHEATDDAKKAMMFEKVRRGDIRVLIGSTAKMGVGTNVQKRLIAMHHLDAPWKPAEVEQRDGRIMRQGNMNPEIEIFRYITKRSFDSFMWQTLERKAKFIGQIKSGARGIRVAEDIDNPLPEAAELKAAASGDPRVLEHAELTKQVRDLEAAASAHHRTIINAKSQVGLLEARLSDINARLPQAIADAAKAPDTKGDAFSVQLLVGKAGTYTKRADAGAALAAFLQEQAKIDPWTTRQVKVATFNGLDIMANLKPSNDGMGFSFNAVGYNGAGTEFLLGSDRTPQLDSVLAQRLEFELNAVREAKGYLEYQREDLRKNIAKMEGLAVGRAFAKQVELDRVKNRLTDLTKEMSADKKAKPDGAATVMGSMGRGSREQQLKARALGKPQRNALLLAAQGFGYKIVDTGLPFGFTDRWGKFHSFGTQIIDKALPGSEIGRWMDKIGNAGPDTATFIKENMSAPWFHRVWFGHDPLANLSAVVDRFGVAALPEYAGQLLKDSLTRAGVPLPGVQWLVQGGLVSDKTATAWLSMNIGEALSGGLSILGTYRLARQAANGEQIDNVWALVGILFKLVGGTLSANPVVLLSAAADAWIITKATAADVKTGLQKRSRGKGGGPLGAADKGKLAGTSFIATRKQIAAAATEVDRITQKILGKTVKTYTNDVMPSFVESDYIAAFSPRERTIYVTMKAANELAFNVGHESLHALRHMGLITETEWTALTAMARKNGFGLTDQNRIAIYRRNYKDAYGLTDSQFDDRMDEEAVADMFGAYVDARESATVWVQKIMDRLRAWAREILALVDRSNIDLMAGAVMDKAYRGGLLGRAPEVMRRDAAVAGMARDVAATPAFKAWFGDSKVVDEDGKPMVVYHGTDFDIPAFDAGWTADDAFYFSPDQATASWFATNNGMNTEPAANVIPVFLSVQNPKRMTVFDLQQVIGDDEDVATGMDWTRMPEVVATARAEGYDGMHLVGVKEYNGRVADQWLAFEPTQIKSIFNGGTFDGTDPQILGMAPPDGGGPINPTLFGDDAAAEEIIDDLAGNINLKKIKAPDDIKEMLREVAEQNEEFIGERRGVIGFAQTAAMAKELGLTEKQLLARRTGEAWNEAYIYAARGLLRKSAYRVKALAAQASQSRQLEDLALMQRAYVKHRAIQEQIAGITAEAGRALSQFRMVTGEDYESVIGTVRNRKADVLTAIAGEVAQGFDLADMIATLDDPMQIGQFVADSYKVTKMDMLREFWINALLSGPKTIAVNLLSNGITSGMQVPETFLAATIGALRGSGAEGVQFGEASARLHGLAVGSIEGAVAAWHMIKTGENIDPSLKIENMDRKAIPGKIGSVIRTPSRLMEGGDQYFKAINYRAELHALALRRVLKEKRTGDDLHNRVAELIGSPTRDMRDRARTAATYGTFQTKLGPIGQMVMNLREYTSGYGSWLIVPFIRSGVNIIKYALERTPFAMVSALGTSKPSRVLHNNLRGLNGRAAQDTAIARIVMGTGIMVGVAALVGAGVITGGGPDDPEERNLLRATGWQPYSVKINGTYYSYRRFEPFALLVGVTADMEEAGATLSEKEANEMASLLIYSIADVTRDSTWLRGPADFFDAFFSKGSNEVTMQRYANNLVASAAMPNVFNQIGQELDPNLRDARTMTDAIKARTPWLSRDLAPRRDVFGQEIVREGSLGPDLVSPVFMSTEKENPVAQALIDAGYYPSMPDRKINGHQLTGEQYDFYVRTSGQGALDRLTKEVKRDVWQAREKVWRADRAADVFTEERRKAREKLKSKWPELRRKAREK